MANEFQEPKALATDNWTVATKKMAIAITDWLTGGGSFSPPSPGGMTIPPNDEQLLSYYGSTNNLANIVYKNSGAVVATQVFEYIGGVPASDDALLSRITLT